MEDEIDRLLSKRRKASRTMQYNNRMTFALGMISEDHKDLGLKDIRKIDRSLNVYSGRTSKAR